MSNMVSSAFAPQRPTTNSDLYNLRVKVGGTTNEFFALVGINRLSYDKAIAAPSDVIANPSLAITVRLLSEYPQYLPRKPSPVTFLENVRTDLTSRGLSAQEVNISRLALMLGCDVSAGGRWVNQGQPLQSVTSALLKAIDKVGRELGYGMAWSILEQASEAEAYARGSTIRGSRAKWPRGNATAKPVKPPTKRKRTAS